MKLAAESGAKSSTPARQNSAFGPPSSTNTSLKP